MNKFFCKIGRKKSIAFIVLLSFFCLIVVCVLAVRFLPFQKLSDFRNRQYSTRFYDRYGSLLQIMSLEDGIRREWVSIDDIPENIQTIFIEAEDKDFYKHHGVNIKAVVRALCQNIKNKKTVSGASTITMQLARLVVPRKKPSASFGDKLKEAFIACRIELKLSKKQILELYLNNLPFGFRTEGIASAARNFYGCTIFELSTEQIETLALIPRRPSFYISKVPSAEAFEYPEGAPHFIIWVKNQYKAQNKIIPPDVYLSLDSALSEEIEHLIAREVIRYEYARVSDGTAFIIDNITGEIIAWCGNIDFYNDKTGQIDGVLVKNQAGSSMKPFLYAMALENGYAPTDVLPDVPSDFGTFEVYVPQNFNNRFNGPQLFRTCLASSLNVPAVYLLYHLGINNYLEKLALLGFDSLKSQRNSIGLSLALGGGEVTLFELVRAFSVFARDGTLPVLRWTKSSESEKAEMAARVYKSDTTRIICDILSDRNARSLGFGFAKVFDTPYPSIFKTGTSNQYQNIIALGSTKRYTAGVWMGNLTGQTVIKETGSSIPAGVVRAALDMLEQENMMSEEDCKFPKPENYKKQKICALSGMSAGPYCTSVTDEYVLRGSVPDVCTWHVNENGRSVTKYPDEYQRWFGGKNMAGSLNFEGELRFLYPLDGAVFLSDNAMLSTKQKLRIDVAGGSAQKARLFVDGVYEGDSERPFSWYISLQKGAHTLTAECGDEKTLERASVQFFVK